MSIDELTPGQLQQLEAIRKRRRELTEEFSGEHHELLRIVNDATNRRSQKRYRFMLLAGGIVGVAAPLLLQTSTLFEPGLVRIGSAFLLSTIIIGAIFDAIEDKRTTPLLVRVGAGLRDATALALAEDSQLIVAVGSGKADDEEESVKKARQKAEQADAELRTVSQRFADLSAFENVIFFGTFIIGVLLLLLAVGTAGR